MNFAQTSEVADVAAAQIEDLYCEYVDKHNRQRIAGRRLGKKEIIARLIEAAVYNDRKQRFGEYGDGLLSGEYRAFVEVACDMSEYPDSESVEVERVLEFLHEKYRERYMEIEEIINERKESK